MTQQQTAAPVATQQNAAPVQLPSQNNKALKEMQDTTVNAVMKQVEELQQTGGLVLPKDYNVGNALKSAWIYLQTIETRTKQKAIDVCTKLSICNCLLELVIRTQHLKNTATLLLVVTLLNIGNATRGSYCVQSVIPIYKKWWHRSSMREIILSTV